ncbi:hypothetical protein V1506DRAFT_562918 [Lipomyces tetrasporus]
MGFDNLSAEITIRVFGFMRLEEIFCMRRVCRYFNNVATDNLLHRTSLGKYVSDHFVSRVAFEEIACETSNDDVAEVAVWMASMATSADNAKCDVESCRKAISVALTAYNGRRWVLENLKCLADCICAREGDAIVVLAAWLGLESVVGRVWRMACKLT